MHEYTVKSNVLKQFLHGNTINNVSIQILEFDDTD